jgi:hypothetical protein
LLRASASAPLAPARGARARISSSAPARAPAARRAGGGRAAAARLRVEAARQVEDLVERRVAQEGGDLGAAEGRERHRILLQELLPVRIVVLLDKRRVQVDAERASVAPGQEQAEAVDGPEERPVQARERL